MSDNCVASIKSGFKAMDKLAQAGPQGIFSIMFHPYPDWKWHYSKHLCYLHSKFAAWIYEMHDSHWVNLSKKTRIVSEYFLKCFI